MTSRFKELKAQYDAVKLNMSKRKVHEFLEKLFQLAEQMESANDCADGIFSELIDRQKAEIVELKQQLSNLEYNRKVKVPQFVAEWIKKFKDRDTNVWHCLKAVRDNEAPLSNWVWADDNVDKLAEAWINGYEVEEEPKYYVEIGFGKRVYKSCLKNPTFPHLILKKNQTDSDWYSELTEQEIKKIDERYWPFAVPVDEVKHE